MPKTVRHDTADGARRPNSSRTLSKMHGLKPRWDRISRKLWLGDQVVKEFPRPSGNQILILEAFEEQGWPECIDDPLPVDNDINPKNRLHDGIKRLNGHQHSCGIRFFGTGNGEAVGWKPFLERQLCAPSSAPMRPSTRSGRQK